MILTPPYVGGVFYKEKIYMKHDAYSMSFVAKKIKELDYVRDYHIQEINNENHRSLMSPTSSKIKLRVWINENQYLVEILLGNPKIEDVLREIQKVQPLTYDIFYV